MNKYNDFLKLLHSNKNKWWYEHIKWVYQVTEFIE